MYKKRYFVKFVVFILIIINSIYVNADGENLEIIVKYKKNYEPFNIKNFMMEEQNSTEKLNIKKITVNSRAEYERLLTELNNDPNVEYAEPNFIYKKQEIPNDRHYESDWGLKYINAESSWDITKGSSDIKIAVIDTGVDLNHPDLINNLIQGKDFVNNDMEPDDDEGHGTLVAQIIGAEANNNFGKVGVSWNSKIMPIKVLDNYGDGYVEDVANGIIYAADNGVNIINLSLGGAPSSTIENAIKYAQDKGVLIVSSSGNYGSDILYPAAYKDVIAVGAIDENEYRASFSCYGEGLSIVAPGTNIIGFDENGQEIVENGTSFSAPYVSGAAALVWTLNPDMSSNEIRWALESSAKDLGQKGYDEEYGYGALDIFSALAISKGDFNSDRTVDIYDLVTMSKHIGSDYGDENYEYRFDLNEDKVVDLLDLQKMARSYGEKF